jgi:LPS-assembly protein
MKYRTYDLQDRPATASRRPSVAVPGASVDLGVFFERPVAAWGRDLHQTLEPRLFLLWVEHREQDDLPDFDSVRLTPTYRRLFREDRFAGRDRVGDAEQASLAVTSRLLDARSGREYGRASVGQIHYFADRRIGLASDPASLDPGEQRSALYSEGEVSLDSGLRLEGSIQWNERSAESERGRLNLSWNPDRRRIVNLGYNFIAENQRHGDEGRNLEESDVSLLWPLAGKWNLIGRWNYDLDFDRTIETLVGVEYDDCCWRARLVYRRYLRDQRSLDLAAGFGLDPGNRAEAGILFEFQFKGLGSLGHRLDSLLEESMRGYEPQEDF